jgi:hypothetical protein
MSMLEDHSYATRQRLCAGPGANRAHYQYLIAQGFTEQAAAAISGWHPLDEWQSAARILAYLAVVVAGTALLAVFIARSGVA